MQKIVVSSDDKNRRIDKYLSFIYQIPYSNVMKQFRNKNIKVNGVRIKDHRYLIQEGDEIISFFYVEKKPLKKIVLSKRKDFSIIYKDDNVVIVDKNPGVIISGEQNSLLAQVRNFFKEKDNLDNFYPINVHQIDKATRGIVVFAFNYKTLVSLQKKWLDNQAIIKKYLAKLKGQVIKKQKIINYIAHDETQNKEIITKDFKNAKKAISIFTPLYYDKQNDLTICEIEILTGRKHQIRVQANNMGHNIIGDYKYGGEKNKTLQLIAYKIFFNNFDDHLTYLNKKKFFIKNINWKLK